MEKRNAIFKEAISILKKNENIHNDEEDIAKEVLKRLPSKFSAYNMKPITGRNSSVELSKRGNDLPEACHGFPLHLPAHVEPCRDGVTITCTSSDKIFRR